MARRNTLDFQVLGGITRQLKHFGGQVFKDGGQVDGGFGTNAGLLAGDVAQVALYTTARELYSEESLAFRAWYGYSMSGL